MRPCCRPSARAGGAARVPGSQLEGAGAPPLAGSDVPRLLGGLRHDGQGTGGAHGPRPRPDDYETGIKYNLPPYNPVDDHGRFTAEVEDFAGMSVWDANPAIIA